MGLKVYLSSLGRAVDPADATVSVLDRGFLYGDSVYETLRTAGGVVVERARHLARLRQSAAGIGFEIPFDDHALCDAIEQARAATGDADCMLRVVVTRGTGDLVLDPRVSRDPLLVVIAKRLELSPKELYERGTSAKIVDVRKIGRRQLDPALKTGNYLNNIQALRQAIAGAAADAILCNAKGEVAEGATSNVFMVQGGRLVTPSLETGLLQGITRTAIVELADALGIAVEERTLLPDELRAADEVFLTSSVRGIMPVTELDGAPIADGKVGAVTRTLQDAYDRYIERFAASDRAD
ncbi:MAG: aminotransferase class IV [Nannocystaceae bacterium]|nr:aminotransferase class IV [Myxococcales bacterium]